MRRDFVCCLRIIVDSFPSFLRNSRLLFEISRVFLNYPYIYFISGIIIRQERFQTCQAFILQIVPMLWLGFQLLQI